MMVSRVTTMVIAWSLMTLLLGTLLCNNSTDLAQSNFIWNPPATSDTVFVTAPPYNKNQVG